MIARSMRGQKSTIGFSVDGQTIDDPARYSPAFVFWWYGCVVVV
jgi:hypothetical protein